MKHHTSSMLVLSKLRDFALSNMYITQYCKHFTLFSPSKTIYIYIHTYLCETVATRSEDVAIGSEDVATGSVDVADGSYIHLTIYKAAWAVGSNVRVNWTNCGRDNSWYIRSPFQLLKRSNVKIHISFT